MTKSRLLLYTVAGFVLLAGCGQPASTVPSASGTVAGQAVFAAPAPANLIKNGSFEKPSAPSGGYLTFNLGDSFNGWTVVGANGNVGLISDTFVYQGYTCPAGCGHQWLDLTGSSDSATGVQQTIAVVAGTTYRISFKVGNAWAASGNIGQTSTVLVYVNGKKIYKATNKKGEGVTHEVWKNFSTTFLADGTSAQIAFMAIRQPIPITVLTA